MPTSMNTLPPKNVDPVQENNPLLAITLGIVAVLGTIGLIVFALITVLKEQTLTQTNQNNGSNQSISGQALPKSQKVVFISQSDKNIVYADLDGKVQTQITTDGSDTISYSQPQWEGNDYISYVKCSPTCGIYEYAFSSKSENSIISLADKILVITYKVSKDRSQIAYFTYDQTKSTYTLFLKNKDKTLTLQTISVTYGRGTGFNDNLLLAFSSSSSHLLFNNTLWGDTPLAVYNTTTGANEYSNKKFVTFANWLSNDVIIFKDQDILYKADISAVTPGKDLPLTQIGTKGIVDGYGVLPSPDGKTIAFWTLDTSGNITTYIYDLDKTTTKLAANFIPREWASQTLLVGTITAPLPKDAESMIPFGTMGIGKVSVPDGTSSIVIPGKDILSFDVIN